MRDWLNRTHLGDCRQLLAAMAADGVRVQCVVTSPPYWGLRDYGVAGQFGLERTWVRHVARMRAVLRVVREVLADDGLLWMNYGDSYHSERPTGGVGYNSTINGQRTQEEFRKASRARKSRIAPPDVDGPNRRRQYGLKPKDLIGMPWRVALALQADGWYLRSDIIWHKPNPMPESVTDRPTKAHEYVFLLAKSERYHYDASAIAEPATSGRDDMRVNGMRTGLAYLYEKPFPAGWADGKGGHSAKDHARAKMGLRDSTKFGRGAGWRKSGNKERKTPEQRGCPESGAGALGSSIPWEGDTRNIRTVWTITTQPFEGAHFATFPEELVARCILAGSRPGDVVLDPFMGSGTVAKVATDLGRQFIGCEISQEYLALHDSRRTTTGMPI